MISLYSKHLENAVNEISKLPGIGKRSALRLALHLIKQDVANVTLLTDRINKLKSEVVYCRQCHNLSDHEICDICANPKRDAGVICVVQDIRDVIAIENTHQYQGVYHVLGGVISPMDGIGIQQLTIQQLFDRVSAREVKEIILALPATVEGDTTNFFIYKTKSQPSPPLRAVSVSARSWNMPMRRHWVAPFLPGRILRARLEVRR